MSKTKRTLTAEQKAKMQAGAAKARAANKKPDPSVLPVDELRAIEEDGKKQSTPDWLASPVLGDVAKGDAILAKDTMAGGKPLENGREEVLKVTRVTENKVFAGSRGFFKTTGIEEGLPGDMEIKACPSTRGETPKPMAHAATTTKKGTKAKGGKKAATGAKPDAKKREGLSQLDAAAKVLGFGGGKRELNCQDLVKEMADGNYWTSPGGKTPHATLHAAICREIKVKGKDSRFRKAGRGLFALAT
jgi:hypothetical protein